MLFRSVLVTQLLKVWFWLSNYIKGRLEPILLDLVVNFAEVSVRAIFNTKGRVNLGSRKYHLHLFFLSHASVLLLPCLNPNIKQLTIKEKRNNEEFWGIERQQNGLTNKIFISWNDGVAQVGD